MGSPIAIQEIYKAGFDDFAIPVYEVAPFTTIQNRAMVTRSLKAIAGVERIPVEGINLLQNEFGANGEQVFESSTKDARVRMVGAWISLNNTNGGIMYCSAIGEYVEITFYGTGLNWISHLDTNTRDVRATVDGGAEGSNLLTVYSGILQSRNYKVRQIIPVTSGLSLGWHTVRLTLRNASNIFLQGFEILNQRTDLAVYSGSGVSKGGTQGLSALTTSPFKDGVVGTRGARVVKYVQGGQLKSAVQEVNASAAYLTSTNHTNEEVVRRINFREFGANRADDFSTLAGTSSARAFTLDDGTTTLIGNGVLVGTIDGQEVLSMNDNSSFITLTFIGTGLDAMNAFAGSIVLGNILVDGTNVGTFSRTINNGVVKICSGLPYGTHTVKFTMTVGGGSYLGNSFIIYQPKKPSIPADAIEVADYNVMADYVFRTSNALGFVSNGVIRKPHLREHTFVGTWGSPSINIALFDSGFNTSTVTSGSYIEYTFFGTGIEFRTTLLNAAYNVTFSINGSSNLSSFSTQILTASPMTFTAATGIFSGTGAGHDCVTRISNIPLGVHKLRITTNNSTFVYNDHLDIITPIHISSPSLKVGSTSLKSLTKYSPEKSLSNAGPDLSKAKAWVLFDATTNTIRSSFNVSAVLKTSVGNGVVFFEKPFKSNNYVAMATANSGEAGINNGSRFAHQATYYTTNSAGNVADATATAIVVFGELADE